MKAKILLIALSIICITACKKNNSDNLYYLDQWIGEYEGTSHHWISYPSGTTWYEDHTYKKVVVDVQKSSMDSCLDLFITYNDSIEHSKHDLKFSSSGKHYSEWGGGSTHGALSVRIDPDSLHYDLYQGCGMVCSSGINFYLSRKNAR